MQLEETHSFKFEGQIWKIHPDPYSGWLVVELRNADTQEVSFLAIYEGELQWEGLQFEALWWLNSVGVFNGKLLIHQYDDSPFPSPIFLIGIDLTTQKIAFTLENRMFQTANDTVLQAIPSIPEIGNSTQFYRLKNGEIAENKLIEFEELISIKTPIIYFEGEKHFRTIKSFLLDKKIIPPFLQIEYLEVEKYFIVSSYHRLEDKTIQQLYLFNVQGTLLADWLLQEKVAGKSPQSFIVHHQRLWFFREKGELMLQIIE